VWIRLLSCPNKILTFSTNLDPQDSRSWKADVRIVGTGTVACRVRVAKTLKTANTLARGGLVYHWGRRCMGEEGPDLVTTVARVVGEIGRRSISSSPQFRERVLTVKHGLHGLRLRRCGDLR
jgi:hypothetical protein